MTDEPETNQQPPKPRPKTPLHEKPWERRGIVQTCQRLLGEANHLNVEQVYTVTLREVDAYAEDPAPCVTFIPLGGVVGIVAHRSNEPFREEDIVFVAAAALGSMLPALGFTATAPAVGIVAPKSPPLTAAR